MLLSASKHHPCPYYSSPYWPRITHPPSAPTLVRLLHWPSVSCVVDTRSGSRTGGRRVFRHVSTSTPLYFLFFIVRVSTPRVLRGPCWPLSFNNVTRRVSPGLLSPVSPSRTTLLLSSGTSRRSTSPLPSRMEMGPSHECM